NAGYMLVAASSLFTASDSDNDAVTAYALQDTGTGHFVLGGVAQANNVEIDVTAAQLSQLSYQNATGTDTVQVRASDGTMWSNWASFMVTGPLVRALADNGTTSLTEVGTHFYLYADSSGSGPSLKIAGMDFVAGQFGPWAPIGAATTASGYEVAWKNTNVNQYTVTSTDSTGNYASNIIGFVSRSDYALE